MNCTLPYLLILTMHQNNEHLDNTVQYSTVDSARTWMVFHFRYSAVSGW